MPASGYASKAAFRLYGSSASAAYPVAIGTPTPETIGAFDMIPFTEEGIAMSQEWQLNNTLEGGAGYTEMSNISRLPGGSLGLNAHYLGLNQLFAACLGYEKVRVTGALESPAFVLASNGAAITGTVTSSTSNTLTDSGASFPTSIVGNFVRLQKLGANADIYSQVRRITARPSATQITVSPNWTNNPAATTPYAIAASFQHDYECAKNMHAELAGDLVTGPWDATKYLMRWGVLGFGKQISVWEWQASYIESLKLVLNREGLKITAEVLPFWIDFRTTGRNSSIATWGYHPSTYAITSRIRFADCKFRLLAHSTSDPSDSDNLGISQLEINIKNNLESDLQTLASGLYRAEPARKGKREVTGSFFIPRYNADTRINQFVAGTLLMGELLIFGPKFITGGGMWDSYARIQACLRSLKLSKADAATPSEALLGEKYEFRCLEPPSQSATNWPQPSAGAENGEIIIRTLDAYPFNNFMGQHQAT